MNINNQPLYETCLLAATHISLARNNGGVDILGTVSVADQLYSVVSTAHPQLNIPFVTDTIEGEPKA